MNDVFFRMENERGEVIIDEKAYPFITFLSADESFKIIDEYKSRQDQCRQLVSKLIHNKLDVSKEQKPKLERIMEQNDDFFVEVFKLFFQNDKELEKHYLANRKDTDICHRFILAIEATLTLQPYKQHEFDKRSADLAGKVLSRGISNTLYHQQNDALQRIPQSLAGAMAAGKYLADRFEEVYEIYASVSENIAGVLTTIAQQANTWTSMMQQSISFISQIGSTLNKFIQYINIPNLNADRIDKLRKAREAWGRYGWTPPPSSPLILFNTLPNDLKDANKKALKYCKEEDMKSLFAKLLDMPHVKRSDAIEAIADFENRRYKSCALVLFGMIDARLIRLQRDEDRRKNDNRRKTGLGAAKSLFKRIEQEQDVDKKTLIVFSHYNILECLGTVFADGDDFKVQPDVINRNFVEHGMIIRKVVRKDCVQLFLLYYNLLKYLDFIFSKN